MGKRILKALALLILISSFFAEGYFSMRKKKQEKCQDLNKECKKLEDCCRFRVETACSDGKCLKLAEEECSENDDCVSGKCKEDKDGDEECTCHVNGKYCTTNSQCCSFKCENNNCQCIESGRKCPKTGKFCCQDNEKCEVLAGGSIPACGKCKSGGEKCTKKEECCSQRCPSGKCECKVRGSSCKTDAECCDGSSTMNDDGMMKCGKRMPNGSECKSNEDCISTNCNKGNGKCEYIKAGESCTPNNSQCCDGICDLKNIEGNKYQCT